MEKLRKALDRAKEARRAPASGGGAGFAAGARAFGLARR